ncbi:MAG: helix-turn-helix transcriptional regulator [Myxococcota bacterium]
MTSSTSSSPTPEAAARTEGARFLVALGDRVRAARRRLGLTRRALAERSGVSERFLAQLEGGTGNVSVARLRSIVQVTGVTFGELLDGEPRVSTETQALLQRLESASPEVLERVRTLLDATPDTPRVALVGLRGAGKSTLGRALAERTGARFVEVAREVEEMSGLSVSEIFSLYGEEGFRSLERSCIENLVTEGQPCVVAAPGGIVDAAETYAFLLREFHVVWLRTSPQDHMARVRAQGDQRPMRGYPRAMEILEQLLARRSVEYGRAHEDLDTFGVPVEDSVEELVVRVGRRLSPFGGGESPE